MNSIRRFPVLILLAILPGISNSFGDPLPRWLERLIDRETSGAGEGHSLVVLLDQQLMDVAGNQVRILGRRAVELRSSDAIHSRILEAFIRHKESFSFIGGWRVQPGRSVTRYGKSDLHYLDADDRYTYSMSKLISLYPDRARVGDIVAWEYEIRSRPETRNRTWWFGLQFPLLESRFGIRVPADWEMQTRFLNMASVPPPVEEEGYTVWIRRNQPAIEQEPMGIPFRDRVPTLRVAYGPKTTGTGGAGIDTWNGVSRWYGRIIQDQIVSGKNLKRTVSGLVESARTPTEAIRQITGFVQNIRYLQIAPGRIVAEPHPAPQVLKDRYGDCEDKTVLAIAMLREIGVESLPVLALTKSQGTVVDQFPTPTQFNHVIVAIRDPGETAHPASVELEGAGRLTFFDPADPYTGFGQIHPELQGTRVLIVAEDTRDLVTLPLQPPASNSRENEIEVEFDAAGGLTVTATVSYTGSLAWKQRRYLRSLGGEKRNRHFLNLLRSRFGEVDLRSLDITGVDRIADSLVVRLTFRIPFPGQDLGSLRTMASRFLPDESIGSLSPINRSTPLRIGSGFRVEDRTTIHLPEGWRAVTLPPSVRVESDFGRYEWKAVEREGDLIIHRSVTVRPSTIPPEEFPAARDFFSAVARGDGAKIALERVAGGGS